MFNKAKVYMIHSWVNNLSEMISYLKIDDQDTISKMTWDAESPDYIFVTEQIYMWKEQLDDYMRLRMSDKSDNAVWIMMCGEAVYPDFNLFDYAICFDNSISEERVGRIPLIAFFGSSIQAINEVPSYDLAEMFYSQKTKFCNFMYSNGNSHPMRDTLFHEISKYQFVESTGRHLHNTDINEEDKNPNWRIESINVKSNYRFSIACENAIFPGYTTEKLLSSFQAHTIPIYWGNPHVKDEYNSEAFIDVQDYDSIDELVEHIAEIDSDIHKWCEYITKPWITTEQLKKVSDDMRKYQAFISRIFACEKEDAIRRPRGFWPGVYEQFASNYGR